MGGTSKSDRAKSSGDCASAFPNAPGNSAITPCQNKSDCDPCPESQATKPATEKVLCEIFCQVRCENHARKDKKATYSEDAKKLSQQKMSEGKLPKNLALEKEFWVPVDAKDAQTFKDAGRKPLTPKTLEDRASWKLNLSRSQKRQFRRMRSRIRGGGLWDAAEALMDLYEVRQASQALEEELSRLQSINQQDKEVFTARPDVVQLGPDGKPENIYDFKFDNPETKYEDTYRNSQKELYEELNGGKSPITINQNRCNCGCKNISPVKAAPPR